MSLSRLVGLLIFSSVLVHQAARAGLVDTWRAADLLGLNDGDAIGSWTSANNRTVTGSIGYQPLFKSAVTPAGGPAVRFNRDWLRATTGSPVAGLTSFSIALVFRADAPGANNSSQWYGKAGLVDAEEGGVTQDWGTVIDEQGRLGFGIGSPDLTVYSTTAPSLVDNSYHAAVLTWQAGSQAIYIDNLYTNVLFAGSAFPRNDAGFSFGATHTGAGGTAQRFVGDLVEVRFYNVSLTAVQTADVIKELIDAHILPGRPYIQSFTATTNQITINQSVTLAWYVTNAAGIRIDPGVGPVASPNGYVEVFPRTNTTYLLTATNELGSRTAALTVRVDQGIPTANNQQLSGDIDVPIEVALAGSDPQGSNLTYQIISGPAHGTLSGVPPRLRYTPAPLFVGNDQFTYLVNDGEFDSPIATVAVTVLAPPTPPSRIVLSTTNISPFAGPGSFIGSLKAVDSNPSDTHTFALLPGFGDNADFLINGNQLHASALFTGGLGRSFSLRIRATDNTGLYLDQDLALTITTNSRQIVINEIHYNPADNTSADEFIELYNPAPSAVDLSFWQFAGGVELTFPFGTTIPGSGFLLLAQDPAVLKARFGVEALGPWSGGLSSDGETVTLLDANHKKINEVSYTSEFPWPVGADGAGGSMGLVNAALDNDLGSSWRTEFPPSPGAPNSVLATNAAPNIRQVRHFPQLPNSTNQIVITAKVTDPDGVASVLLQYQIVRPGNYLPSVLPVPVPQLVADPGLSATLNPEFENESNWISAPMVDDGTADDALAGDDVYTATIPPQSNRVLVRYRIVVTDQLGLSRRAPFEDDPSLNFGCFVYDGIPAYQGTSSQVLQSLPFYCLLSRAQDISQCSAYDPSYQLPQFANNGLAHLGRFAFNWPGTMVYDGVVYDHIRYRLHGANGRYQPGKRNWRFEFNRGHYLAAQDQNRRPFPRKWTHLTTGKGSNNRLVLTYGLNEVINYFLWNKVGVPAPHTFFFHFRVIDEPAEARDPYNGDFWGLNWAQEDYDGRFLDSHGLAKGNLYKLINASLSYDPGQDMVGQQRYQAAAAVTNGSDGAAIQAGLLQPQTSDWIRAHVDCQEWFRYHAICEAVRNYDFWPDANKNAAWYFEPPYSASNNFHGRFWTLPWDTDSTWGPTWNDGRDLVYNGIFLAANHPDLRIEYANTVREIRDLLIQPDQINPLIDSFSSVIAGFVPADLARWSNAPASSGSYSALSSEAGFVSPALNRGLSGCVQDLKNFMFVGGTYPWWIDRQTIAAGGWATRLDALAADPAVPLRPALKYIGPTNFPVTGLLFESTPFSDPQGTNTFKAMQWRVGEISSTNDLTADPYQLKMEWDAVWDSGIQLIFTNQIQVPSVNVLPGHRYRARVRHQDNTGRWSNWSAPLEFVPASVDLVSILQKNLIVSEVMYHPPNLGTVDGSEFEFLELRNQGLQTLDLSGLTFTAGINFTFTNGTALEPGQYFLLGRNAAQLQGKYPGITVNGIYTGKLDNSGETITLTHPYGIDIFSITYGSRAPWTVSADGFGFSLVADGSSPTGFRASFQPGGSPSAVDPAPNIPAVVINEALTAPLPPNVDTIELLNPTTTEADIGGWWLTDDAGYPWKFRIPDGTVLSAGGNVLFNETQFNPTPGIGSSFSLSSLGEEVYLFSGNAARQLTGYTHGLAFGGAARGESFGRYLNSIGEEQFPPQWTQSLGSTNLGPRVGPVVINEVLAVPQPPDVPFVELFNLSSSPVPLFDVDHVTNTWRVQGLGFTFPTGVFIPAGGFVLLTSTDPGIFRSLKNIPAEIQIFQYPGQLDTNGEALELRSPGAPSIDEVPYFLVDRVRCGVPPPWIVEGPGCSFQRIDSGAYGDDPINWRANHPTPGPPTVGPTTPLRLQVESEPSNSQARLSFETTAGRAYLLEYKQTLLDHTWLPFVRVPAGSTNHVVTVLAPSHPASRFFRVSTPGF